MEPRRTRPNGEHRGGGRNERRSSERGGRGERRGGPREDRRDPRGRRKSGHRDESPVRDYHDSSDELF